MLWQRIDVEREMELEKVFKDGFVSKIRYFGEIELWKIYCSKTYEG